MSESDRRSFLAAVGRLAFGAAALQALPPWSRPALAGTVPPAPGLIERNDWPEHWETTVEALGRADLTSNELFFARSHFTVPAVDVAGWRLEVGGQVETPFSLTLAEIRALPAVEAVHTLECAGNGRALFDLASTSGTQWERGAVGTARWKGIRLATLLERAGVKPEARHVWLEAADRATLPTTPPFLRSIPVAKAKEDVLLAYEMNGRPLPRLHGAPLRAVVPGWFGMASTKWVTRIRMEATPSDNHFMVKGYRYAYPGEDPAAAPAVEEVKVKSLITRPLDGARVGRGRLVVEGFAWAGPPGVARVEVSADGGATWLEARLTGEAMPGAWRRWQADVPVMGAGALTLRSRATGGGGETQPARARANAGGYGNNSIHVVRVHAPA